MILSSAGVLGLISGGECRDTRTFLLLLLLKGGSFGVLFCWIISWFFLSLFLLAEEAHQAGMGLLIHCQAGVSRSATIVIAYLMKHTWMTMTDAYKFVKTRRPIISPNLNFMGQLLEFEEDLNNGITPRILTPKLMGVETLVWTDWLLYLAGSFFVPSSISSWKACVWIAGSHCVLFLLALFLPPPHPLSPQPSCLARSANTLGWWRRDVCQKIPTVWSWTKSRSRLTAGCFVTAEKQP